MVILMLGGEYVHSWAQSYGAITSVCCADCSCSRNAGCAGSLFGMSCAAGVWCLNVGWRKSSQRWGRGAVEEEEKGERWGGK
jgi:hypothetical protein